LDVKLIDLFVLFFDNLSFAGGYSADFKDGEAKD
jgi:hypothetical protein